MKHFFRKRSVTAPAATGDGESEQVANPYLNARREWNSQTERAFSQLHVWQLIAVAGLLIGLAGVAGVIYVGSKSKYVPYVIEVDKLGEAVSVGPAQLAAPADPRVVRATLASFIASTRLVTPDVDLERKAVFTAYAMVKTKDAATTKLNEWFNGSKDSGPFERAKKVTVSTDINSVLPISASSWQVDWTETVRSREDGSLVGQPIHMRAVLEVYILPPSTHEREADIERNPLGIFVRDFTCQEL
jgi:type IV secretory pathway TrbF-like protein